MILHRSVRHARPALPVPDSSSRQMPAGSAATSAPLLTGQRLAMEQISHVPLDQKDHGCVGEPVAASPVIRPYASTGTGLARWHACNRTRRAPERACIRQSLRYCRKWPRPLRGASQPFKPSQPLKPPISLFLKQLSQHTQLHRAHLYPAALCTAKQCCAKPGITSNIIIWNHAGPFRFRAECRRRRDPRGGEGYGAPCADRTQRPRL